MEIIDSTLQMHMDNGKVAPAYLLIDKDILKLKKIALWFSKNYHTADIFWLTPKENINSIQVEATESFIEKVSYAAIGSKKLFIIADTSTMTLSAQNKILKTIEDETANTTFLLLASNSEKLLNTIKSRCVTVNPDPLSEKQVLSLYPTLPPEVCDGTLTNAALYTENKNAKTIFQNVEQLLLKAKTLDEALPLVPLLTQKENFALTLSAVNHFMKKFIFEHSQPNLTCQLSIDKINVILNKLSVINRNTEANCNAQNIFDSLIMEIFNE